jgi:hypothetical protein
MMKNPADWIQLYIGCETNKGVLVGVLKNSLFIHDERQVIVEYSKEDLGTTVFLYLRKISDLTEQQSDELISKGFVIGRPSGYSFSNEAFLYLLGLSVDLFGIINSGLAKDINKL